MLEVEAITGLLQQIQSNDSQVIKDAESRINDLCATNVDGLVSTLVQIGTSDAIDTSTRQAALLVLKPVILQHWNIGFEQFTGPAISTDIKNQIRGHLMQFISTTSNPKLENATALLLSRIASVDFPDEWPNLLDELYGMVHNAKDRNTMNNALMVLHEVLNDALSEIEFFKIAQQLTGLLLSVFSPDDNLAQAEDDAWKSCTLAAQCFHGCLEFFLMAEKSSRVQMTDVSEQIIDQWMMAMPEIVYYETQRPTSSHVSYDCVIECLECVKDLMVQFPELMQKYLPIFAEHVWANVNARTQLFVEGFVLTGDGDMGNETNVSDVIGAELNFLWRCISFEDDMPSKLLRDRLFTDAFIGDLLQRGAQLGQLTEDIDWTEDANTFATEETDMSIQKRVRVELTGFVCALEWNSTLLDQAWHTFEPLLNDSSTAIKLRESALNILGCIIDQLPISEQRLSSSVLTGLPQYVSMAQVQASDELQVRAHIVAGILVHSRFAERLPERAVDQFLQNTCTVCFASDISSQPVLQVACLMALKKYMSRMESSMVTLQNNLLNLILTLSAVAEDDLLSVLMEAVEMAASLNYENAVKTHCRDIVSLLFSLAAKDAANVELGEETISTYCTIITESVSLDSYPELCEVSVESFRGVLMNEFSNTSQQIGEYSPELILCLELMQVLVAEGVSPTPAPLVDFIYDPVSQLILRSQDTDVLQTATSVFCSLAEHASEQLRPRLDTTLSVIGKLLDPSWSESAVIGAGKLISAVIRGYGMTLGEYLPKLVGAVIQRLENAEYILLIQNLVSVFCSLALESAKDTINLLVELNGLEIVLSKWLEIFESLSGYKVIQQNVEALQKIYDLNDARVDSIIVKGDQIAPSGVIITRSKRNQLTFQQISAYDKILKILAQELSATLNSTNSQERQEVSDEDDEWEDLPEILQDQHECDLGTYNLIVDWFRRISQSNTCSFHDRYLRLTEKEQAAIRQALSG